MTVALYSLARLLLLLAAAGVLWITGARGLLLWVLAFVISGLLSLVLLRGLRARMSESIAQRSAGPSRPDNADGSQDRTE